MHQTINERWNRISLRTKITGVTVLMLTLGLLVSGIGTAAMLRSYVEEQTKGKLATIASGDLMKYFTDEGGDADPGTNLDDLAFRPAEDVFVAVYDEQSGKWAHNWGDRDRSELPHLPSMLTPAMVNEKNANGYQVFPLRDADGNSTFRAVAALMTADQQGTYAPIIIAVSSKATEQLLAV
jgi:two-component system, OmpR family, sensor kinase